jgi:hypothetical protein
MENAKKPLSSRAGRARTVGGEQLAEQAGEVRAGVGAGRAAEAPRLVHHGGPGQYRATVRIPMGVARSMRYHAMVRIPTRVARGVRYRRLEGHGDRCGRAVEGVAPRRQQVVLRPRPYVSTVHYLAAVAIAMGMGGIGRYLLHVGEQRRARVGARPLVRLLIST